MQIGKHSPKLVELRKAIRQGTSTADGLLPIEGPILLEEAHRSGIPIVDVFVRAGTSLVPPTGGTVHELSADVFKTIQDTEQSQGIIATVRLPGFRLEQVVGGSSALVVVLCRIQDPGNAGTILRITESFGGTGCIALRETASLCNGKVVRASAGSLFRVPHVADVELQDAIQALRSNDILVVGSAPAATRTIEKWDWRRPVAVLVGNEGRGLNEQEIGYCDEVLRIPHKATVESLNSAIATAVMLYEASKQRR